MHGHAAARWPPPSLRLAPRVFAERLELAETAIDRWVAGWTAGRGPRGPASTAASRALLRAVGAHAPRCAELDDAALRTELARGARRAFVECDTVQGAMALAAVVEAARRSLGLSAHRPQIEAAWALLCGRLVELDTGEGKTLTAALAACVAAAAGVPVHVITVNDYLAQRDAAGMGPLFAFFGLDVGVVHAAVAQPARACEYARAVVYCTNKDIVFDYLRDRVGTGTVHSQVQLQVRQLHRGRPAEALRLRGLHFGIVDEADSVLIDEARTPLILSSMTAPAGEPAWAELLALARNFEEGRHFRLMGEQRIPELQAEGRRWLDRLGAQEAQAQRPSALAEFWRVEWVREHYIVQALRALHVLQRDHQYVVLDGKIVIVDEFTGRLLADRSWEQGLHQLVEAKEGLAYSGHNRTLARLTYQSFFARYLRLSGMSGTLREVARETASVYRVGTRRIEPNRPCLRIQLPTRLCSDVQAKAVAVVEEVRQRLAHGQPVLVGTPSVQASQTISAALAAAGIAHRVLNALQNAEEAELVAAAGQRGAVTVATNMAGRGTDIGLGEGVAACGGLHVVLTEWHESARIDRQLFGRCARQGEPGSCRAIVALDDEVVARHAGAAAQRFARLWPGTPPALAVHALRRLVQGRAEASNAAQRRQTMRQQRAMQEQLAFSGVPE